ncbi:MAG: LysM peptidoglycan-binding domain-containing protein [Bacteroidaceae bacterium]|nr:LysM peptidoglycan-binding domain-containing protein [Bacteroidaceae bacterium]
MMKFYRNIIAIAFSFLFALNINAQEKSFTNHTVERGQTLYSISKMYNTTVEDIIKLNPECKEQLSIGQQLKISTNSANANRNTIVVKNNSGDIYHTIQSGETLYRLSKIYEVTAQEICDANPGLSTSNFRVGEVVIIPNQGGRTINKPVAPTIEDNDNEDNDTHTAANTHKVKKGETLYSISKKYGITIEELTAANPILIEEKLKRKMVLNIPDKQKSDIATIADEIIEDNKAEFVQKKNIPGDSITRIAVVLPFLLDSYAPSEQGRMIEYYQGFLMAVEKLKNAGYSFEINTYDSGHKGTSLNNLLATGKLNNMDLIIGALYPEHNKELSIFAQKYDIPLVIPFTNKSNELFRNPMAYFINAPQSQIIPEVSKQFINKFPNANVVFVEDTIKSNKQEFIAELTDKLDLNGMNHTTIPMSSITTPEATLITLKEVLKDDKENIIIPTSSDSKTLNNLLPSLVQAKYIDTLDIADYKLFGYPEWQIHAKDTKEQLYEVDTYFYTTFYSHYSMAEVSKFQDDYIRRYNCPIQNIYPKYGMLGYDTGYYMLLAISLYGKDLPDNINNVGYTPIQTGFHFERIGDWGGLVNKKIYFVHYTRNYSIEKIDLGE